MTNGFIGTIGFIKSQEIIKGNVTDSWGPGNVALLGPMIPEMTSNTTPEGVCTCYKGNPLSGYPTYEAFKAFNSGSYWRSGSYDDTISSSHYWGKYLPFWVQYEFAKVQNPGTYKTSHGQGSYFPPKTMEIIAVDTFDQLHVVYTHQNLKATNPNYPPDKVSIIESESFIIDFPFKAIRFSVKEFIPYRNNYRCTYLRYCQLIKLK